MKKSILIIALATSFTLGGCAGVEEKADVGPNEVKDTNFYQHWVQSFEEQSDKQHNIFRPKGSREFPAARFRMEFAFDPDGRCNYKFLAPNDRHELRNCVFTKIGNKVYIYSEKGKMLKHLSFRLAKPTSKDEMNMSYGVHAPNAPTPEQIKNLPVKETSTVKPAKPTK